MSDEFSYRYTRYLLPVVNQREAGACSIIAALRCCSAVIAILTETAPREFSFQELINEIPKRFMDQCEGPTDAAGCYGVRTKLAFRYIQQFQAAMAEDMPFQRRRTDTAVPLNRERLAIDHYYTLEEYPLDATSLPEDHFRLIRTEGGGRRVMDQIKLHPIVGKCYVYDSFATFRGGGIYRGARLGDGEPKVHAMLIIGYGKRRKDGLEYFVCQNTYGTRFGDNGFCKIARSLFLKFAWPVGPRIIGPGQAPQQ